MGERRETRTKEQMIEFSGARNPLLYIQDEKMHEIKGDKQTIGGIQRTEDERSFSLHQLKIEKPTYFYLFSDGYQDQFGGPNNKKFMIKRLKELLLDIHEKPMAEQKNVLLKTFRDWVKPHNTAQIDDVIVIGVRI